MRRFGETSRFDQWFQLLWQLAPVCVWERGTISWMSSLSLNDVVKKKKRVNKTRSCKYPDQLNFEWQTLAVQQKYLTWSDQQCYSSEITHNYTHHLVRFRRKHSASTKPSGHHRQQAAGARANVQHNAFIGDHSFKRSVIGSVARAVLAFSMNNNAKLKRPSPIRGWLVGVQQHRKERMIIVT